METIPLNTTLELVMMRDEPLNRPRSTVVRGATLEIIGDPEAAKRHLISKAEAYESRAIRGGMGRYKRPDVDICERRARALKDIAGRFPDSSGRPS